MELTLVDFSGWLGALLVISAYAYVSYTGSSRLLTQIMNLLGAFLLLWASAMKDAWFSVGLNGLWIIIALIAILSKVFRR